MNDHVPAHDATVRKLAIQHLPPVAIEGHRSSGAGGPDHPMRIATRRAAGLDAGGWTGELRHQVEGYFDGLAGEWHTRTSPQRTAVVMDALLRGLGPIDSPVGLAVEVGSGIGTYSNLLAERFATVVAIDLSLAMLKLAPIGPAHRVQADGASFTGRRFIGRGNRADQRLPVSRRSRTRSVTRRRPGLGQQQRRADADLSLGR